MASPGPMQPANASERAQPPYRCYVLVAEGGCEDHGGWTGGCKILDMDFRENLFHALG